MMPRRAIAILGLLACKSADPVAPVAPVPAPPVAAELPSDAVASVSRAGAPRLEGDPILLEQAADLQRVAAGPLRAEVTPAQVALGDDRFAAPIIGAARAKAGWIFLAADGAVAGAASFLGPLRALGQVPRGRPDPQPEVLPASCGRLAVSVDGGGLWTTDGAAPISVVAHAPPGTVVSAAFADADHGMIILDGGELFLTRDGTASFERVDLGSSAAAEVACQDEQLRVLTSDAIVMFDRDGHRVASAPRIEALYVPDVAPRLVAALANRGAGRDRVVAAPPIADAPVVLPDEPAVTCAKHGAERAGPPRERPVSYGLSARGRVRYQQLNADVTLQVARGPRWDVTWRGRDWLGAYGAARATGPIVGTRSEGGALDEYQLKRVTRDGVVIRFLGLTTNYVWVPRGGRPRALVDDSLEFADLEDLVTLPDATLAVLVAFKPAAYPNPPTFRRVLVADRSGRVIARRSYYWPAERGVAGLAVVDGAVGVERIDAARQHRFLPVAVAAHRPVAAVALRGAPICKPRPGAPAGFSVRIADGRIRHEADSSFDSLDHLWRVYLREGAAACVQGIELSARGPVIEAREVYAAASTDGELRAEVNEDGAVQGLRCTVK